MASLVRPPRSALAVLVSGPRPGFLESLPRPSSRLLTTKPGRNAEVTKWTKARSPIYTYVDFKTDVFFFSDSLLLKENILAYLKGQHKTRHNWIRRVHNIALRFPQSILAHPTAREPISKANHLVRCSKELRVLYLVIDPTSTDCPLGPPSLWHWGAGAVDVATGFINFEDYDHVHGAEMIQRGIPGGIGGICSCPIEKYKGNDFKTGIRFYRYYKVIRPHFDIKVVVDALAHGIGRP